MSLQLEIFFKKLDDLQFKYGSPELRSIYGAGAIKNPSLMLIFMNPTARNISSSKEWRGVRAPWLGTKNVWRMLSSFGLIDTPTLTLINTYRPHEWTEDFSRKIYEDLASQNIYLTNLAKCTQEDARPLSNKVFREYLPQMYEEIEMVAPQKIITFGNQVSSILLDKNISVSNYSGTKYEELNITTNKYKVYPTYYPVGQGQRNLAKAISRIQNITLE